MLPLPFSFSDCSEAFLHRISATQSVINGRMRYGGFGHIMMNYSRNDTFGEDDSPSKNGLIPTLGNNISLVCLRTEQTRRQG